MAFTHSKIRRLSHKISDFIFSRLTGEKGYFDTQIVYVTEKGRGKGAVKQLALMDQDGQNSRLITYGKSIVMTPRFSPTSRQITYMDYGLNNRHPRVYILNLIPIKKHW